MRLRLVEGRGELAARRGAAAEAARRRRHARPGGQVWAAVSGKIKEGVVNMALTSSGIKSVTRRDAVIGAAAAIGGAALAAGAGSALASSEAAEVPEGMDSQKPWLPATWDYEADVIAIGGGGAGLAAGIEAADQGLSIIILESQAVTGGNSIRCNGGMTFAGSPLQAELGIEDSEEDLYNDLINWFGTDYDDRYVRLVCHLQSGDTMYNWLLSQGIEFQGSGVLQSNGHSRPREHHITPSVAMRQLEENALAAGADLQLETTADKLYRDAVTGRVVGVRAQKADGTTANYKAKKAVLLCCGGYGRNVDMLAEWNFSTPAYNFKDFDGSAGQLGQGIKMAQEIGADLKHMSYCHLRTTRNPKGGPGNDCAMYHQGGVLVNLNGERFVDESLGYQRVWTYLIQQPQEDCFQVWDQAIADKCADNESGFYSQKKIEAGGYMLKADTYEELAEQMGVPADAFAATMEKYNEDIAATGVDSVCGRKVLVGTGGVPVTLDHPPYYAYETVNVMSMTVGGVRRSDDNLLLAGDTAGKSIPGLYMAGNISDYCNFGVVPGTRAPINASGMSFGPAISLGRYCIQQIAENESSWDE